MTPTTDIAPADAYAGASQPAAAVAGRAIGAPTADAQPRAQSDGYFTDADGVRKKIVAGDPVPPGVELEGTDVVTGPAGDSARVAELEAAVATAEQERDAAQARVAELEASSSPATEEQKAQQAAEDKARKAAEDKARKAPSESK